MLLVLLACAASDDLTGDSSGAGLVSEAGHYTLTLTTEPDPPVVGEATLFADVPAVTALSVEGEMVGMGHGFAEDPVVTGGDGVFEVGVDFSMSGTWQVAFTLDGEAGPDTLVTQIEVR